MYNLSLIIGWEVALQATVAITITTQRVSLLYHQIHLIVKFVPKVYDKGIPAGIIYIANVWQVGVAITITTHGASMASIYFYHQ